MRKERKLIVKPRNASGGKEVHLLEFREGSYWCDGESINDEALTDMFRAAKDAVVVEYVRQGTFAAKLYPKKVNTIRLVTMLDPESRKPFIVGAGLRIGCARSVPKDNYYAGGLYCNVDLETGRLDKAMTPGDTPYSFEWIDRHPETTVAIEEQAIPDWGGICEAMLDLAGNVPMLPYVAWDVAMLDQGISVIEGNHWCELDGFQMYRPLLADPRVRRFLEHHNVL